MQMSANPYIHGIYKEFTMRKLRNGATLIEERTTPYGESVVLGYWEGHVAPWVTWRMDREGNTFWGSYHRTREAAAENLAKRAGENNT